jgi:membrane protein DedA with SNARE-associated domain
MIEGLLGFLEANILPLGVVGVFVASVVEEVVAPIPSALIMTMSGFIFVQGDLSWGVLWALIFKVAIPAALGVTLGSYVIYYAAKYGGKFIIERWGRYLGLYWKDIEKLRSRLSGTRKDELIIAIARIVPFVPSVAISAFCGILEMNIVKYTIISFVGVFFRGIVLGAIGWQAGNVYERYAETISSIENTVLISTIFAIAAFVMLKYKHRFER